MMCVHHIAADGWSIDVLIRDLINEYEAACNGDKTNQTPSFQYIDYTHWQHRWLAGDREQQQLSYWKENLAGVPTLLELPTDYARPAVQRYRGEYYQVELPTSLVSKLKSLAECENASLFMLLLSAFNVLLAKYSGQQDIAIGTPVANRPNTELENIIGFFANTLVLRNQVASDLTMRQLLRLVRSSTLSAYSNQDLPFEQLVEQLQPNRSLSHSPLFQVMFSLQHQQNANTSFAGLEVEEIRRSQKISKFDLSLMLEDRDADSEVILNTTLIYLMSLLWRECGAILLRYYNKLLFQLIHLLKKLVY